MASGGAGMIRSTDSDVLRRGSRRQRSHPARTGCRVRRRAQPGVTDAPARPRTVHPSSRAPGSVSATTQPPNPPPTRRAPYTPGVAASRSTSASTTGVDASKSSRLLAWDSAMIGPGGDQIVVAQRGGEGPDPGVLGDHVAGPGPRRRVGDRGHVGQGGVAQRTDLALGRLHLAACARA